MCFQLRYDVVNLSAIGTATLAVVKVPGYYIGPLGSDHQRVLNRTFHCSAAPLLIYALCDYVTCDVWFVDD